MPLGVFLRDLKHRILCKPNFETSAALKAVVEHYFHLRFPSAKVRRDKTWEKFIAFPTTKMSRFVL